MAGAYHLEQNLQQLNLSADTANRRVGLSAAQPSAHYPAAATQPLVSNSLSYQVAQPGGMSYQYAAAPRQPASYPRAPPPAPAGRYPTYAGAPSDDLDFPPPPPPIVEAPHASRQRATPPPAAPAQYPCQPPEGARSVVLRTPVPPPTAHGYVESRASAVQAAGARLVRPPLAQPPPGGATAAGDRQAYPSQGYGAARPQQDHGAARQGHREAAEVDALTSLLMKTMEASGDPDFYGMCAGCGKEIIGEKEGCSAIDQVFHCECFTCKQCGTSLGGQAFFALEGKLFCETCYMNTLEKCSVCVKPITDRILRATGKPYHPACFTCVVCSKSLVGIPFTVDASNQIHCIDDFHRKFAPRCCVCCKAILPESGKEETVRIVAMDKSFHVECYRCEDCGTTLSSELEGRGCYPLDEHILCKSCNARRIQNMTSRMTTEL